MWVENVEQWADRVPRFSGGGWVRGCTHIRSLGKGREERIKKGGGSETRHFSVELKSPVSASPCVPPSPCFATEAAR